MILIVRANENNFQPIVNIGKVSVSEAHRGSCPPEDLADYIQKNYNEAAILKELLDKNNAYHILYYNGEAVGFSKIILNAKQPNISFENAAKLDRIYFLKEFQGLKLGFELLNYNVNICKNHQQIAIWLYTWIGNEKAITFYQKTGFKIIGSHEFYVTTLMFNVNHQMLLKFT